MSTTQNDVIQLDEIAAQLFDGYYLDTDLESLSDADPEGFCTAILAEKKNRGSKGKIELSLEDDPDDLEPLFDLIERVRTEVNEELFERFWECFVFSMDISVGNGGLWGLRVLANGGLMIRNLHRIIGFDGNLEDSIEIPVATLKAQLDEIHAGIEALNTKEQDPITAVDFSLVHRDEKGVYWTQAIPERLSKVGQTLIFINEKLIEKLRVTLEGAEKNLLLSDSVLDVAACSRTGHCVLRVFVDRVFLFSTSRLGDEYDTLAEYFSYIIDDAETGFNKPLDVDFSCSSGGWAGKLKEILQECAESGVDDALDPHTYFNTHASLLSLVRERAIEAVIEDKRTQMSESTPIFASTPNQPSCYMVDTVPYWTQVQDLGSRLLVLETGYDFIEDLDDDPVSASLQQFGSVAEHFGAERVTVRPFFKIHGWEREYCDATDLFVLGDEPLSRRLESIFDRIRSEFEHELEECSEDSNDYPCRDFLRDANYSLALLLELPNTPNLSGLHTAMLELSEQIMVDRMYLIIPAYGLVQGYSDGEIDTGNIHSLLPNCDEF